MTDMITKTFVIIAKMIWDIFFVARDDLEIYIYFY